MKNISATNGTSLVQIFLMADRSTVEDRAWSTLTPGVCRCGNGRVNLSTGQLVDQLTTQMDDCSTRRPVDQ